MDALSHALLSFILGQALQLDTNLQLILIISSISLDIDAISIRSREAAFRSHRGPIHSILAALLASALISAGYATFMHLQTTVLLSVIPVSLAGVFSHLILDLFTTGNMTALWPFSKRNFAFSLTHFIDPLSLTALVLAVLLIIYTRTDVSASKIVAAAVIVFLSVSFGVRGCMKNAATKIIRGLYVGVASEIVSLPTLRPDRWRTVSKKPFDNGYRYEIFSVDSVRKMVLGKSSVENPYINYSGFAEPPIDTPQKAVACSKKDERITASIGKFLMPTVNATPLLNGNGWRVFWYDVATQVGRGERRGILVRVETDGTVIVGAEATYDSATEQ